VGENFAWNGEQYIRADKYISIIDININYTATGCQGDIQLSMLSLGNTFSVV